MLINPGLEVAFGERFPVGALVSLGAMIGLDVATALGLSLEGAMQKMGTKQVECCLEMGRVKFVHKISVVT